VLRSAVNILSGASLLLCFASTGLWVRSYWVADRLTQDSVDPYTIVASASAIRVCRQDWFIDHGTAPRSGRWLRSTEQPRSWSPWPVDRHVLGFEYTSFDVIDGDDRTRIFAVFAFVLPFWSVVTLFATAPAMRFVSIVRARRRRHRRFAGLCQHCGYDLRASPGRCPECGALAEQKLEPQMNADARG
jgi:hypothetical protein